MNLSQYKRQNTLGIAGLSRQLCREAVSMGFLKEVKHPNITCDSDSLVHLFLYPLAADQIIKVASKVPLTVSSCYRTLAQQYILKRNLLTLVAPVGRSDHGSGKSLDITNYSEIESTLISYGFSQSYGSRDAVHFDYGGIPDNRSNTILAFQRLWNKSKSGNTLDEDGSVGAATLYALSKSPCNGFKSSATPRYLGYLDSGKDVGDLQFRLRDLGIFAGMCDGMFGIETEKAVKTFQSSNNLNVTGIVNHSTYDKLYGK